MFGRSQKEKTQKLTTKYNEELKDLLISINANTDRTNLYANIKSGGYDQADALHNVYTDFGYPSTVTFFNFWHMYRRFGVATAVVDIPPDLCWLDPPIIEGSDQFNKEIKTLIKNTHLWSRLKGVDKRQRVGRYAGLFIQAADSQTPDKQLETINGVGSIHSIKPIFEGQLSVATTEQDTQNSDFGNPTMYDFNSSNTGDKNEEASASFQIHPSRIIIAAEGADDGSIYGVSSIESVFNDLMDLRKIGGAGGEGFYQNTRSAPIITTKDGYKAPTNKKDKEDLEAQIDDFLGKWQKKFVSQGLEFNYPNISLDNPKDFAENSWNNIAAGSKIPTNILRGSQTGRLAGDKDNESFLRILQSRRENFLTELVRSVIDWMIINRALPSSEYEVIWTDLLASSVDDKLTLGSKMAETNEKMLRAGMSPVYTENEIRELSGFEPQSIETPTENIEDDYDK